MNRLEKEFKMSFKVKVAILLLAALVSLAGFNLVASSSALDMLKMGKRAGYAIIANVLAGANPPAHRT
jgi:hypothetical protein